MQKRVLSLNTMDKLFRAAGAYRVADSAKEALAKRKKPIKDRNL